MGERTGSRVLQWVWSYVMDFGGDMIYVGINMLPQTSEWDQITQSARIIKLEQIWKPFTL
ncbi:hypothetical protein LY79DRAFT_539588 [Colletotrichum navitas]|uniref:Uncharacterized protein n=1 Tax=Colletotrichum navitas TaxID=681940 RepID=A0AAD8Q8M4_9PEZI|nr:hypothetical protein LY79DRAFT_539588 [Colletotrichum navitas]